MIKDVVISSYKDRAYQKSSSAWVLRISKKVTKMVGVSFEGSEELALNFLKEIENKTTLRNKEMVSRSDEANPLTGS